MFISTSILPLLALTMATGSPLTPRLAEKDVKIRLKGTDDCLSHRAVLGRSDVIQASTETCSDAPKWTINGDGVGQSGKIALAEDHGKVLESSEGGIAVTLQSPRESSQEQQWTFLEDGGIQTTLDFVVNPNEKIPEEYCLTKTTDPLFIMRIDACPGSSKPLAIEGGQRIWEVVE
ncbi:hypothetical protein I302_105540 [Kwoniella bestiolae CBS 10118]|uniref:Uncharacterized protein n=1 Tax=Kwoniella bestiolae CBS 10118 TaxID=1296100 RepID=A0A1B9FTF1_9TREE|nr:hypothetical protein I302_08823 [Kwoniella bestiolae CBS 10118]OCF22042.1 hypothetical protein I302_08823 [Kwoniella bestiolae CBS 10118]